MGNTELIKSNYRDIVDPLCIEGRLPIHLFYMNYAMALTDKVNVHWFDDRGRLASICLGHPGLPISGLMFAGPKPRSRYGTMWSLSQN
jgi:hypothetical protein